MKKKVVFFMEYIHGGGAEKVAVDILNYINKEKYDVTLVVLFEDGLKIENLSQEIKVRAIMKKSYGKVVAKAIYYFMKYFPKIAYKLFIPRGFNIEIAFLEGFATKIISFSTNKESKKIAWVHTDLSQYRWTNYVYRKNEEASCYRRYDDIIFVSNDASLGFDKIFNFNNIRKSVVYNPINRERILEKSNESEVSFNEFTIISVGRLIEIKGFDRLIKAHAKLVEKYPHKLVIIGEGNERGYLEQLINTLGVKKTVDIMGFMKNPYPYVKAADLFVSTSKTEGYGLAVAEAILLEKPVMITNISGTVEVLGGEEYGVICENSQEGIDKGLEYILQNTELLKYYKEKSKERQSFFKYGTIIKQIEGIFDK